MFGLAKKTKSEKALSTSSLGSSLMVPVQTLSGENQGNMIYALNSIESLEKRLADYLFMMQDYAEALNCYRNVSKTFLNDKSWRHFAAASEMTALCIFLQDPFSKKDLESPLDNAYAHYSRDNMVRFAIRSTFFFGEILKVRRNFGKAAQKFIRAAKKENDKLCSAMLLEQAALCSIFMSPPQLRRFGFRLIDAGNSFASVNQNRHALRCFLCASKIYEARNWGAIDDHNHFHLARQSFMLDRLEDALGYMERLLVNNCQAPHKQSSFLREFLHIFQKVINSKGIKLPLLPLPMIKQDSVVVILREYPSKSPLQELWKQMEKSIKASMKPPQLPGRKKKANHKEKSPPCKIAVTGETIFVDLELQNPLKIPFQLTNLQLLAAFMIL